MTSLPTEVPVLMERVDSHIALVTLNRPAARNAVNSALARALDEIVRQVEADRTIRVAVLTGAGDKAFSAGADLKEKASGRPVSRETEAGGFAGFVHHPRKKLWIAAVRGFALAGGCELALACDFIVAGTDAKFGLPEAKRGLVAYAGGVWRLPRLLPRNVAMEMIATGEPIESARAYQLGLVNHVVAPDAVVDEALRIARIVCANAPLAVQASLEVARKAYDLDDGALRALATELRTQNEHTEDAREGPRAFAEGRAPRWQGR